MPDSKFLEQWLDYIAVHFRQVEMIEIGVANGATMYGVAEWCESRSVPFKWDGFDLPGIGPETKIPNCTFHPGRSEETYIELSDQCNLLFIDGDHSSNAVCLDFLNFSPRLKVGGVCLFHDTVDHPHWVGLAHSDSYQGHGPKHPDFGIGVRMALKKLGLLDGLRKDWRLVGEQSEGIVQGCMTFQKVL